MPGGTTQGRRCKNKIFKNQTYHSLVKPSALPINREIKTKVLSQQYSLLIKEDSRLIPIKLFSFSRNANMDWRAENLSIKIG